MSEKKEVEVYHVDKDWKLIGDWVPPTADELANFTVTQLFFKDEQIQGESRWVDVTWMYDEEIIDVGFINELEEKALDLPALGNHDYEEEDEDGED